MSASHHQIAAGAVYKPFRNKYKRTTSIQVKILKKRKIRLEIFCCAAEMMKKKNTPRDLGENETRRNDDHAQCTTQIKPNFVLLQRVTRMRISSVCVHANGAQIIIEKEENEIKKKNFNNNNNWRCKNSLSFESV